MILKKLYFFYFYTDAAIDAGEMIAPFHRFYSFIYKYHPAKSASSFFVC